MAGSPLRILPFVRVGGLDVGKLRSVLLPLDNGKGTIAAAPSVSPQFSPLSPESRHHLLAFPRINASKMDTTLKNCEFKLHSSSHYCLGFYFIYLDPQFNSPVLHGFYFPIDDSREPQDDVEDGAANQDFDVAAPLAYELDELVELRGKRFVWFSPYGLVA